MQKIEFRVKNSKNGRILHRNWGFWGAYLGKIIRAPTDGNAYVSDTQRGN